MRLKFVLLIICAYAGIFITQAQYRAPQSNNSYRSNSSSSFVDNIYFGGGGGFSAGQDYLSFTLTPIVGYKITDEFSAGLQITYQYIKIFETNFSNYGGGPFLRYNITEKFFGYTEYEYLSYGLNSTNRLDFFSWFLGIGYSEPISDKVAFNIMALYNVLHGDGSKSPYASPFVFRAGIVIGL